MFYKFSITLIILSFLSVTICDAATAPAPTNALLLKRIQKLETQVKSLTEQNVLIAKQIDNLYNYQKENYSAFSDLDYKMNKIENMLNGSTGLKNQTSSLNTALNDTDGIICRLKQIENDIYKNGTRFHSYEPTCVTY